MPSEPKAAVKPTGEGIVEGNVVVPPWWDDPAEQGRETVRLLKVIAAELTTMNGRLAKLERLVPQGVRSPLAGLLGGIGGRHG